MGNAECCGGKSNRIKLKQKTTTNQLSFTFTLIWLDDEQEKNPELKHCLKQIDQQMIKLDDSDLCETYIKERPNNHFILIVCHKLGNILVPEIDELSQLDSVFIYDFLSNDVYKSWMKQCQKIINDVFIDLDQLESSIKDHIGYLRKIATTNSETVDVRHDSVTVPPNNRLRSDTHLSSSSSSSSRNSNTIYYLIWLDMNANNDELTKNELKSIITCQLLTFNNVSTCEQYVFDNPNAQFIFIVSYEFGSVITPTIASLKQTVTIIVYSKNRTNNIHESWIDRHFVKVQPIVTNLTELKTIVQYELHKCGLCTNESNISENDIKMDVFNKKEMTTKNLQLEKGNFLWFKLFVEVLIHMKDSDRAHHDLVEILRENYPQSNFVGDFNQNYKPDEVIEWFTRDDSCLLKELNKALRQQNLDHLFIFRYLINDMYQQLRKDHDTETKSNTRIITLYRSQVISQFEIDQLLEANTGELIAINSFMLTWGDRMKAIDFLKKQRHLNLKHVLFEIEVDYRKKSNPFARINSKDDITLFMLGCIFRILSITQDNILDCYVLKLELCCDDDTDLKNIFDFMTLKAFIQPDTDLITLGSLLYKMGELDKARKYFELILTELDINDPNYAHCYDGLGNIENDQGRLEEALKYHQQALELRMNYDIFHTNNSLIALSHIHIAYDYKDMGDYDTARAHVKKAQTLIRKRNLQEDQAKEAACHIIEGSILYDTENDKKALEEFEKALNINKEQGMPDDHPDLASIYQSMGLCHLNPDSIHDPTVALDYCTKALKIRLKALPHNHHSTGITCRSIGLAYEQLKQYQDALEFYQKANIIHKALNRTINELKKTDNDIKRIQKYLLNPASQPTPQYQKQKSSIKSNIDMIASKLKSVTASSHPHSKVTSMQETIRRIILLGRSNAVKTSFGKALLAEENDFMINQGSSSIICSDERSNLIGFRDFYGTMLMIVDTPSFDDANNLSTTKQIGIAHSLELASPGPHAFVFVLEFTPDSLPSEEDDKQLTESLINIFGPEVFQYIVFVFSNLEKLQENGIEIDRYMKNYRSQAFADLMNTCKNRFIVINNQAPPNAKDASFVELTLTIDRMLKENEGKGYTYRSHLQQQTSKFTTNVEQTSTIYNSLTLLEEHSSNRDTSDRHSLGKNLANCKETHHLSNDNINAQSAPIFNSYLIGLSLQTYKHHIGSSQQNSTNITPILLKPISNNVSNILIVCLDVDASLISSNSPYLMESFDDDCACIARLLSMIDKSVYFIVSSSIGKYIIPIVYQHRCIEQIYIYSSDNNQRNVVWITRFPKIRDCWNDYRTLVTAVHDDIQSILSRSSSWSNVELIDRCYTQTLIKSSNGRSVSLDLLNVENYSNLNKRICIVVLHCDNYALFDTQSQRFPRVQFSDVTKCVDYIKSTDARSLFFIISGELKSVIRDLKKMTILKQVYAIYLFVPVVDQQELDEILCSYKNIGRLFDNIEFLLTCLTSDIKFYLEQPLYRTTLSIFASQNNTRDNDELKLTDEQKKFAAFQILITNLREAPAAICRNKKLYDRCFTLLEDTSDSENALEILKTETNKIFDWFVNAPFLSIIINSFLQEEFPQSLLNIQQVLMAIDQRFTKLSPIASSSVVYRVQLICEEDLKTIKNNVDELVAFHTYLLATKDLLPARTIARQAVDRGLLIAILQIEIPAQTCVLEVDTNRLMFRFGSIFSIRSIDLAPDSVWYVQLKYADSDFQPIKQRLQIYMGEEHTWLTLGSCLRTLDHYNEAKFYYDYLINTLPKNHQALPSIYNNMGLMLAESGDDKKAIECLKNAMELFDKISPTTHHISERVPLKTLPESDEVITTIDGCTIYDKMAEVYLRQSKHDKALECYHKALELTIDPLSRVRFEQKIKNIVSLNL